MPLSFEKHVPAVLALVDGTVFRGYSVGATGHTRGEVVFNTAMTGYQEILTDPSYSAQIVTLTYPHIGNTGVNPEDTESGRVYAAGLVVRDVRPQASNFRMTQSLQDYLSDRGVVAIAGIDTRKLTRTLREKGAQSGAILVGDDAKAALDLAYTARGLVGLDLAREVTTNFPYVWEQTQWMLGKGCGTQGHPRYHVVVFDYGVKHNILRMLAERECRITVLPATAGASDALALSPDGILLSNGPGDPGACSYAIQATKEVLSRGIPTFGICLGHQIMALASGAKTSKMKFGHHGANHPVQDVDSGKVLITSQNHGFSVDKESLPACCRVTHVSLFDGTLQGFERTDTPAFCFQGHPEASPGPCDIAYLFDRFVGMMKKTK
ncbi:MAG: glutamine-hydrolyzing carbamoyl-phosphate synthase small subunit [Burkholderiaceae bacterium]|nr:glutamine-hydrolyzing carbamoyl-phosphate synthase small subunit [Burkholderiaceae bacterium]